MNDLLVNTLLELVSPLFLAVARKSTKKQSAPNKNAPAKKKTTRKAPTAPPAAAIAVPSHLKECVVIEKWEPEDQSQLEGGGYLTGHVRCSCGGEKFEFLFPGQTHIYEGQEIPVNVEIGGEFFFVIKARCAACRKEHLLFDSHFHGWDGFVCHDPDKAALPRPPLSVWSCRKCGSAIHSASIGFQSEGKEDFIEATDGAINKEKWMDGFGWFNMALSCCTCGNHIEQWVSYEAM